MARDHAEAPLDLHRLMVAHPAATFFMRMQGDAMAPLIQPGDLLVVDRSLPPRPGQIVVASADGRWFTRRWDRIPADSTGTDGHARRAPRAPPPETETPPHKPSTGSHHTVLRAENPRYPVLRADSLPDLQHFGVVTWIARKTE